MAYKKLCNSYISYYAVFKIIQRIIFESFEILTQCYTFFHVTKTKYFYTYLICFWEDFLVPCEVFIVAQVMRNRIIAITKDVCNEELLRFQFAKYSSI